MNDMKDEMEEWITGDIDLIPLSAKKEDTFEYWVNLAHQGRNVAECWQECYRIAKNIYLAGQSSEQSRIEKDVEKMKKIVIQNDGTGASWFPKGTCKWCGCVEGAFHKEGCQKLKQILEGIGYNEAIKEVLSIIRNKEV